jgi:nuclear transport factor 2 (NTF2) superfamily protein
VVTTDELDDLLYQKFRLRREDMLAALKTMPTIRPWAAELSPAEARLLDDAGFTEDPDAYAQVAADTVARMAVLINTAYSARDVAAALNVNESRVRQRRLARTLWAINDNGAWVFPALQFETDPQTGRPYKQIRGLDRVFAALSPTLHPLAVAGFLRTPHTDLALQGRPVHPLEWLQSGGDVDPVLRLVEAADWASR